MTQRIAQKGDSPLFSPTARKMGQSPAAKKTGLASRMREWMKGRERPFTGKMLYDGLGIEDWDERQKVHNSLGDFLRRGEVTEHQFAHRNRRQNEPKRYRYNHKWRRARRGTLAAKIFKAVYVSGNFAASDIERLTDSTRNHVAKQIRKLREAGYLTIVGRRPCNPGAENIYHVPDRDAFRTEVM